MSTGNEGGAEQNTETYDAVVEDLNFDPEIPDVQPHPVHPGPGAHSSQDDNSSQDDKAEGEGEGESPQDPPSEQPQT